MCSRWIWHTRRLSIDETPNNVAPMICDAMPARYVPSAESLAERHTVAALQLAEAFQAATTRGRCHGLDHQPRHVTGFIARMTVHAPLRPLIPNRGLLAWN